MFPAAADEDVPVWWFNLSFHLRLEQELHAGDPNAEVNHLLFAQCEITYQPNLSLTHQGSKPWSPRSRCSRWRGGQSARDLQSVILLIRLRTSENRTGLPHWRLNGTLERWEHCHYYTILSSTLHMVGNDDRSSFSEAIYSYMQLWTQGDTILTTTKRISKVCHLLGPSYGVKVLHVTSVLVNAKLSGGSDSGTGGHLVHLRSWKLAHKHNKKVAPLNRPNHKQSQNHLAVCKPHAILMLLCSQ